MNAKNTNTRREEMELSRHGVTPAQFLAYVRQSVKRRGLVGICSADINLAYFAAGNDLSFDIRYDSPETGPVAHERSVSRPYEMQTYVRNWDGTTYNCICEFDFWDEKTGNGYFYFLNEWEEQETGDEIAEESSEDQSEDQTETAEETETDRDGETVAESLVLPTDSDRVRAICERIAENIAEYATMPVDSLEICIADGNEKVGHIKNVSQPPVISCRGVCAECGGDCYDGRAVLQYPDTAAARGRNWSIYTRDPLAYFGQIIGTVRRMRKRFFRWHVGGEIVDGLYFRLMVGVARLVPRVTFLCFTKRHKLIADELAAMGGRDALPSNLRLILSAWPGLPLYNPYNLPVSAPYAGDKPRAWYGCPGNCEECAARNIGCWSLPAGAVVGFAYHGTAGDLFAERFAAWEDRPTGRRPKRTASSKKGAATA